MTGAPIFWPADMKTRFIGKDPDARKDGGQEEKGATENEMVGWHHWINGHEFEQTPGDGEGQGSLLCCNPLIAFLRLINTHPTNRLYIFLSPVLYSRFLLIIYLIHSSVSMSIPIPQFIPPIVFPVVHVCYLHLCLYFCFTSESICTIFFLDSIYILLLDISPRKTIIPKDTCIPLFTATLFAIARTWK